MWPFGFAFLVMNFSGATPVLQREANISRQLFKHDLLFASDEHSPGGKSLGWGGNRKTWVFVLELPHISRLGQIL